MGAAVRKRFPLFAAMLISAVIIALAFHGKLRANLQSENYRIAQALVGGRGFADAMGQGTGPTAWSAPVMPFLQALLLWAGDGHSEFVVGGLVILQVCTLLVMALLILLIAWRTTSHVGGLAAAAVCLLGFVYQYWYWFELAHDCWLMLLALDVIVAGLWLGPLQNWKTAALWGLGGGFCFLSNPAIGVAWAVLSFALIAGDGIGGTERRLRLLMLTMLVAILLLSPWTIRNYRIFGRFIPVKSNLAFELYLSQVLQPDGLLQSGVWQMHPSSPSSSEHQEYRKLGEAAYLEQKKRQFQDAVANDPLDFLDRVASRFLRATVWYVPFNRTEEWRRPWLVWTKRAAFVVPLLAFLFLIFSSITQRLLPIQRLTLGLYVLCILPYIVASYYERYEVPLVVLRVLVVIWALDRLAAGMRLRLFNGLRT